MSTFRIAALALAAGAGAANAQGFKGAEIDLNTSAYTDDTDVGQTTLQGSLEFGVTDRLAFAADIGSALLEPGEVEAGTATLHVIFDASPTTSLGFYLANDEVDAASSSIYGLEGGFGFGSSEFEFFAGVGTIEDLIDISVLGFDGTYRFGQRFALTASFGYLDTEFDIQSSRFGIGAEARIGSVSTLYIEVGQDNVEGETADYVGVGARFAFGPNRGTTFDPRGLVEVFSGL